VWVAATVAGSALISSAIGSAWLASGQGTGGTPASAAMDNVNALRPHTADVNRGGHDGQQPGAGPLTGIGAAGSTPLNATANEGITAAKPLTQPHTQAPAPAPAQQQPAAQSTYGNPLRGVSGLIAERVDMGADFGGTGPVYAIGDAVITNATANSAGWPGGGWITYRLTDGPAAGLMVYLAEDVTPTVQVGQHVSSSTVIANMFAGGDGIETGWAMPDGASSESELAVAGGISGGGPFPTIVGLNFEGLLESLGVPAGNNAGQSGFGTLPANYPASWK
jgi:hypothetical protein